MDDFDVDWEACDPDIHCPPPVFDPRHCTCPCHKQRPTLAEQIAAYAMLAGCVYALVLLLQALVSTH
ncbi:hypothetical protein IGS68_33525 (plasmid) [Skermanella sp. TT6]|uniref:Uncharacterized protein n=1 Tax=Skermanella cutis TaxID=2775420 RepID=A0ABX7BM77_9PROT|nr:hypothetical protein [Skermanella sp. TT6]QQP93543.1 hypothetical protein IGS68_33525 [Skermanella sp. TT6]